MNWYKTSQKVVQFSRWDTSGTLVILIDGKRYEYSGVPQHQSSYIRLLINKKNLTRLFPILKSLKMVDTKPDESQLSLF